MYLFWFLCMYGLPGLLPTSGENIMSIAPLEIYLLIKMVMCSILILPAVCPGFFLHKENVGARLKQLPHCPDKRQHSPTNANILQQSGQCGPAVGVSWRMLALVGYCRKSSTCSVGSGKVGECLTNVEPFPTNSNILTAHYLDN